MDLQWTTSFNASCLHAAEASLSGALVDGRLDAAVAEPSRLIGIELAGFATQPRRAWQQLYTLLTERRDDELLAASALKKLAGPSQRVDDLNQLASALQSLQDAVRDAYPNLEADLVARERPLREQWEARGPGMLLQIRRQSSATLATAANVLLVHPATGGGGASHLLHDTIRQEAMLAHPMRDLPETVRMAWLLSQLNHESRRFLESDADGQADVICGMAMLPPCLLAGEYVDLCKYDAESVALALEKWRQSPSELTGLLMRWWREVGQPERSWEAALIALRDRLSQHAR